jgi:uncharacterized protein (TIGR04255 family)
MPAERIIFNHPPAKEVRLEVTFPNSLEVADGRNKFYQLVRAEFPVVVMPEQSKMTYDLSDYALYTDDRAERLEIGMSYFRLASTRYAGFKKFRTLFLSTLGLFVGCYEVRSFVNLSMTYENNLSVESDHKKFADLFNLEVRMPQALQSEPFLGKGLLVFQKPEGYVSIQFEPQAGGSGLESYSLTLYFVTLPGVAIETKAGSLETLVNAAHAYLDTFFFELLTDKYLDYLRAK